MNIAYKIQVTWFILKYIETWDCIMTIIPFVKDEIYKLS